MGKEARPKNDIVVDEKGRNRRPWALPSRDKILAATVDEIADVGYERARVVSIAKRAGMTAGSLYTWFENKEDLFRAALQYSIAEQVESNKKILEHVVLSHPENWLFQIGALAPRNAADQGPTAAQILILETAYVTWRDSKARPNFVPHLRDIHSMYVKVIMEAQEKGTVTPTVDAESGALVLMAIPLGIALLEFAGLGRPQEEAFLEMFSRLGRALKR